MQDPNHDSKQSFWQQQQQQQKGQKEYQKNAEEMEQDNRDEEDSQNYEPTSFYMEFDDGSDSDDFSDSEDDFIVPTTTTTTLIRSGRRSPTISSYPQNNPQYNPFLSNGANKSINNNNINKNANDHKLYGHKIIATNVLNRKRKKEITRRAQHRSNAVVIRTIYIMTTTTGERSASASPTSSPTTTPASSDGSVMMPIKPAFKSNSDSFGSKKRSKGIRSPTRNLIGTGKRQLLSSRKLK